MQTGRISVIWEITGPRLTAEWCETGGPAVAHPQRRGFGLRLLDAALKEFDGVCEARFEGQGLICQLYATLPSAPKRERASEATVVQ